MRLTLAAVLMALSLHAQAGSLVIHMMLHAIGEERYEIAPSSGGFTVNTTHHYADRGFFDRTVTASLRTKTDYTPVSAEVKGTGEPYVARVEGSEAMVQENGSTRTFTAPDGYFAITGPAPFALQMVMMRYWRAHEKPAGVEMLRAEPGAEPVRIEFAGRDTIAIDGRTIGLERYTIANLMFGREVLWMDEQGNLAAAMTFAGGLPMEAVRDQYEPALPELFRKGVAQEMADLEALGRETPPELSGAFAIAGAILVDATGAPPVEDAVVIVRNGRIAAAGPRSKVPIPHGMTVLNGKGQTLLPGLWEMHTHFSGVEFGPALLASGITTARDCGGEFDYLVAQRDAVEKRGALGPRLLLAGLVDSGGAKAFGHVVAETPEEGRAVVDRYRAAGFQQIKLYTYLTPEVVKAIAAEAHRLGMTVTGHVPRALNTVQGIEAGMDQINHLNYVSSMVRAPGSQHVDLSSEAWTKGARFLLDHHTVVDPTAGWGEMSGHSKEVDAASFEPGILKAPFVLDVKFRTMGGNATAEQMRVRMKESLAVIGGLHKAGVPIIPGSDTGLVGYGLHRELELYVEAGMTPMEAIQCATIVSARAMNLDRDAGTIEPGKRADLILVDGNPLKNVSDLRRVSRVVANGRVYDPSRLWRSVGFRP
ncbi:MAG: amidohydrolase family protein [Candidatus Sulfopaludibacter sp.]|nr:amidohydrolase family protein [Candidatus Sulfopaludibacter sp.]